MRAQLKNHEKCPPKREIYESDNEFFFYMYIMKSDPQSKKKGKNILFLTEFNPNTIFISQI